MFNQTKCITTGIDDNNISKVFEEKIVPYFSPYEIFPSFQIQELFYTEDHPQTLKTQHLKKTYDINLPQGAMRFLKIRMPAKKDLINDLQQANMEIPADWTKYNLHNTDSVDYIYVLSGEITCVVGEELVHLTQGDFLTQVGPIHTWVNNSDEACEILCVMVGIEASINKLTMEVTSTEA
jgi:mannose-6-phosphate isomerase-like protein (cupin superfamily)